MCRARSGKTGLAACSWNELKRVDGATFARRLFARDAANKDATLRWAKLRSDHRKTERAHTTSPRMATRDDLPTLDVASRGTKFVDNEGRTLTLRGVNLGGAKLPAGYRSDQSEAAGDDASALRRALEGVVGPVAGGQFRAAEVDAS